MTAADPLLCFCPRLPFPRHLPRHPVRRVLDSQWRDRDPRLPELAEQGAQAARWEAAGLSDTCSLWTQLGGTVGL